MLGRAERFMARILENIGTSSKIGNNYIISDDSGVLPPGDYDRCIQAAMLSRPIPEDAFVQSAFLYNKGLYICLGHCEDNVNNKLVKVRGSWGEILSNIQIQNGIFAGSANGGKIYYGYLKIYPGDNRSEGEVFAMMKPICSGYKKHILTLDGYLIGLSDNSLCVWSIGNIKSLEKKQDVVIRSTGNLSHRMGEITTFFFAKTENSEYVITCLAKQGMFVLSPVKPPIQTLIGFILGEKEANYVRRIDYPGILRMEEYIPILITRYNDSWVALSKVRTRMLGGKTMLLDNKVKLSLKDSLTDVPRESVRRMFIET